MVERKVQVGRGEERGKWRREREKVHWKWN
jgi:hypothetical protein